MASSPMRPTCAGNQHPTYFLPPRPRWVSSLHIVPSSKTPSLA